MFDDKGNSNPIRSLCYPPDFVSKVVANQKHWDNRTKAQSSIQEFNITSNVGTTEVVFNPLSQQVWTTNGRRDVCPLNYEATERVYQARQMNPPKAKPSRRWDMVNPWTHAGPTVYGDNNSSSLEMMINDQLGPLPFANDNLDQVESFAKDENFDAFTNPRSNRFAMYNIHPELKEIEARESARSKKAYKAVHLINYKLPKPHAIHTVDRMGMRPEHHFHARPAHDSQKKNYVIHKTPTIGIPPVDSTIERKKKHYIKDPIKTQRRPTGGSLSGMQRDLFNQSTPVKSGDLLSQEVSRGIDIITTTPNSSERHKKVVAEIMRRRSDRAARQSDRDTLVPGYEG